MDYAELNFPIHPSIFPVKPGPVEYVYSSLFLLPIQDINPGWRLYKYIFAVLATKLYVPNGS